MLSFEEKFEFIGNDDLEGYLAKVGEKYCQLLASKFEVNAQPEIQIEVGEFSLKINNISYYVGTLHSLDQEDMLDFEKEILGNLRFVIKGNS